MRFHLTKSSTALLVFAAPPTTATRWDEVMLVLSDVFLCGGDCVEDVNRSECHLRESPEIRTPTSHTVGRAIKELSNEDLEYKSSSGNVFRSNTNPRLNDLLMKLNMKMGLFKSG